MSIGELIELIKNIFTTLAELFGKYFGGAEEDGEEVVA